MDHAYLWREKLCCVVRLVFCVSSMYEYVKLRKKELASEVKEGKGGFECNRDLASRQSKANLHVCIYVCMHVRENSWQGFKGQRIV